MVFLLLLRESSKMLSALSSRWRSLGLARTTQDAMHGLELVKAGKQLTACFFVEDSQYGQWMS